MANATGGASTFDQITDGSPCQYLGPNYTLRVHYYFSLFYNLSHTRTAQNNAACCCRLLWVIFCSIFPQNFMCLMCLGVAFLSYGYTQGQTACSSAWTASCCTDRTSATEPASTQFIWAVPTHQYLHFRYTRIN